MTKSRTTYTDELARPGFPLSRRNTIRLGTLAGSTVLVGVPTISGLVAGRSDGEILRTGLYTEVKNKIHDYRTGVFIGFDGEVSIGEPEDTDYFESKVKIQPVERQDDSEDSDKKGVRVKGKVKGLKDRIDDALDDLEDNQSQDQFEIQRTTIVVTFESTAIGARIDSQGEVVGVSDPATDADETEVLMAVRFEGIGTSPSVVSIDLSIGNGEPIIE